MNPDLEEQLHALAAGLSAPGAQVVDAALAEIARLRAVIASKEALVAEMATALKRLEDVAGRMAASVTVEAGRNETLRGVAILGAVADACTEARAIAKATEGQP